MCVGLLAVVVLRSTLLGPFTVSVLVHTFFSTIFPEKQKCEINEVVASVSFSIQVKIQLQIDTIQQYVSNSLE